MKSPTFLEGVLVALTASLAGSALYAVLAPSFGSTAMLRLLVAGIGLGYLLYLLRRGRERVGRITVVAIWSLAALVLWLLHPPFSLYLMVHIGLIWLVRSLYFYASVLSALTDLALSGVALATAVWAATHTGSLLLSVWCFFLLQALFVAIPHEPGAKGARQRSAAALDDRFQQAHRAAEAAIHKLSSIQ
jgi:hypothetical protein